MSIRPVREVPSRGWKQPKESMVDKEMREFLRLGYDAAVVEVEGKSLKQLDAAVRGFIKAHPRECASVRCGKRGDHIYVWREVVR